MLQRIHHIITYYSDIIAFNNNNIKVANGLILPLKNTEITLHNAQVLPKFQPTAVDCSSFPILFVAYIKLPTPHTHIRTYVVSFLPTVTQAPVIRRNVLNNYITNEISLKSKLENRIQQKNTYQTIFMLSRMEFFHQKLESNSDRARGFNYKINYQN